VAGLLPPGSTAFHLLLAVDILAGLTSVVSGAAAALSPKRPGRHPRLGTLSYRSRWVVVASAAWLAALRWPQDAYLLVPGALCWPPRPGSAAALGPPARPRLTPTGGRHAAVAHPKAPTSNPQPATAPPDARAAPRSPTRPFDRPPQPIGSAAALLTASATTQPARPSMPRHEDRREEPMNAK
jgi:hypothetical protein